jgi:pyroglutamyl-peptidase
MTILLTAFGPFADNPSNPSMDALDRVPSSCSGHTVIKAVLPVSYRGAPLEIGKLIASVRPDAILMTGLAKGRKGISVERIAINVTDSQSPDNDGITRGGEPVDPSGPAAYMTTLNVDRLVGALKGEGILSYASNHAGAFVCNATMYEALKIASGDETKPCIAGFVHLPLSDEAKTQGDETWSMPLQTIVKALSVIIATLD